MRGINNLLLKFALKKLRSRLIAIDMGSNTVRAVKYDCKTGKKLATFEKIVKTADKTHTAGIINDEAKARVVAALEEMNKKLGSDDETIAVATAVYRKAKNALEFLKELEAKFGLKAKIIDGETEAFLTSLAVEEAMKSAEQSSDSFLLADIGGGSTEIIFKKGDRLTMESFDVGIVAMAQKYRSQDALEKGIKKECLELKEFIKDTMYAFLKPQIFCATAGTPTTIAALKAGMDYKSYDGAKINGAVIGIDDVDKIFTKLLKISEGERTRLVGFGREDLIIAGILIFKEIFEASGFRECIVFDDGLREGVAISSCKKINIF